MREMISHDARAVLFCCSGVGILDRGIEIFFREAFDALRDVIGRPAILCKGAGEAKADERVLWSIPRTSVAARLLGKCLRRDAYTVEQLSSLPSLLRVIQRERPAVIFSSDANLGFQLFRWRRRIGVPFRLLFSNGGPCHPPFDRTDFVHQVVPLYREEALAAGEPEGKHVLVPYGIHVGSPPDNRLEDKHVARQRLGLPPDRRLVLSVGWIARRHKRMHYVIEELAALPEPRPYLQLLGDMDEQSSEIVDLGNRLLGAENFSVRSVPHEQVSDYYKAADVFTLASLVEGFGRVYPEALVHGLPVIAHKHPVMEYVLGQYGRLGDLSQPGALASLLAEELMRGPDPSLARARYEYVRSRFGWPALAADYAAMFERAARAPVP